MDIASAKQQIKNTVQIYLQKDALGHYRLPLVHQRPIFLLGAPGLGKTAIMQQVADEMGLGLVSYSMTHHTRQSALGLPVIVEKEYGGKHYQVSEYTMSEIIASVYDCMRTTGKTQGILYLDEINCVSETLSPAMLLFLQYKVFGGHQIPEGWVVVTAGNPPRFNKSVREFDAATRDRLKVIEVEPSYEAWKAYALEHGVSRSVISYLDIRPEDFYKVETTVDGLTVVTPRAWEDLSEILLYHEELGLAVSEELTTQYLQNKQVARDFAIYYELYQKYRQAYNIDAILQGVWDEDVLTQARSAKMDERMSLVSLLLEAVFLQMERCTLRHDALRRFAFLDPVHQRRQHVKHIGGRASATMAHAGYEEGAGKGLGTFLPIGRLQLVGKLRHAGRFHRRVGRAAVDDHLGATPHKTLEVGACTVGVEVVAMEHQTPRLQQSRVTVEVEARGIHRP